MDQREKLAHVLLQVFEGVPDVHPGTYLHLVEGSQTWSLLVHSGLDRRRLRCHWDAVWVDNSSPITVGLSVERSLSAKQCEDGRAKSCRRMHARAQSIYREVIIA